MKNLPGPNEMPEHWFARFVGTIPTPMHMFRGAQELQRWRDSWRPIAQQLWAEAWLGGAAYQEAISGKPAYLIRTSPEDAEKLIEQFRAQLGGLPDAASEE